MTFDKEKILSISKELNEPQWLLQERLKAFKIYSVLAKPLHFVPDDVGGLLAECSGFKRDSLHSFLESASKKAMARELFLYRFFKPEISAESAFISAFFTEANMFGPSFEKESGDGTTGNLNNISISDNGGISVNFFILPENCQLKLYVNSGSGKGAHAFESYLSENSRLHRISIHNSESLILSSNILQKNSKCTNSSAMFSSSKIDHRTSMFGEGASYSESSVLVLSDEHKLDFTSSAFHHLPGASSDISIKGTVKDSARATVNGLAKIYENASKSSSRVSAHVLLLNRGAHAVANPDLEILNSDVVASHAASVSEIDEDQLFYLMSRGIPRPESKDAIVEGFLSADLPEFISNLVYSKLNKKESIN